MFNSLAGKFLIANPFTNFNEIFDNAVIYVASHTEDSAAVGLMINHLIDAMPYKTIFKMLKSNVKAADSKLQVYLGGPVEPNRGFILHTDDYDKNILFSSCVMNIIFSCLLKSYKICFKTMDPKIVYSLWAILVGRLDNWSKKFYKIIG